MLKQFSKSSIMIWKVQNELKKLIDIDDITQELLHKLIYKNEHFHYLTDYSGSY